MTSCLDNQPSCTKITNNYAAQSSMGKSCVTSGPILTLSEFLNTRDCKISVWQQDIILILWTKQDLGQNGWHPSKLKRDQATSFWFYPFYNLQFCLTHTSAWPFPHLNSSKFYSHEAPAGLFCDFKSTITFVTSSRRNKPFLSAYVHTI